MARLKINRPHWVMAGVHGDSLLRQSGVVDGCLGLSIDRTLLQGVSH